MSEELTNNTAVANETNDALGRITTGISQLYYKLSNGTPTRMAGVTSFSATVDTQDSTKFYSDNELKAEVAAPFSQGSLSITVDGLTETVRAALYGVTSSANWTNYGDAVAPYVKIGVIQRVQTNQNVYYIPYVFTKCQFKPSSTEAASSEEQISFQTETLEATIFADDDGTWKIMGTQYDKEGTSTSSTATDEALKALYTKMNS